jgi:hypothetical protein
MDISVYYVDGQLVFANLHWNLYVIDFYIGN